MLIEDRSFSKMREKVLAEQDPARRMNAEKLMGWQTDQFKNFAIEHGVIRSGVGLIQEFSLRSARVEGSTLTGRALWHEDIHDPGDASEESISLKLEGDVLEFAHLDDQGAPLDPVYLRRSTARNP